MRHLSIVLCRSYLKWWTRRRILTKVKLKMRKIATFAKYIYHCIEHMKTVALLSTSTKELRPKPAYVKPVHKTYRELLQLDRPRKKIEYESSSSEEEDFLEKLLA